MTFSLRFMTNVNLTKRQFDVLKYIKAFMAANGRSPTLSEIAKGVKIKAVSTIHKHVQHLIEKDFLERISGAGNNIVLREDGFNKMNPTEYPAVKLIPYWGVIAAGTPSIDVEPSLTFMEVPKAIHRDKDNLFALRVKGNSMEEDSILEGDTVIIQKQPEYRNGDRVVALIDGEEATLKEFKKDHQGVWLIPHNSALQAKCFAPEEIQIQGKLIGVMRSC